MMFKQRFCHIEMIKFNQSLWKVYRISTEMPFATLLLTLICTNVWIHTSKMNTGNRKDICFRAVSNGYGTVNYSGIFTMLAGARHTKDHGDPAAQCANWVWQRWVPIMIKWQWQFWYRLQARRLKASGTLCEIIKGFIDVKDHKYT